MTTWTLGVIGGSGLYDIDGLENKRWIDADGPWGAASDQLLTGEIGAVRLVFLPRHGRGHAIPPGGINARANIHALKQAGCTDILSISAVGSLREELDPGTFVVVDQYIDRTVGRTSSFFGEGCVAHVSAADPVCGRLAGFAAAAARAAGARVVEGGTYLAMEGPQFSTRAESRLYRAWGCDVIGMTGMPEAKLAREAELPYASICMVTDYDCWHEETEDVEVDHILKVLHANAATGKAVVKALAESLGTRPRAPSPIDTCLDMAIITPPAHRDPILLAKLDVVAGRALRG
jgi:5'-methylthioadenosine phosphorylase